VSTPKRIQLRRTKGWRKPEGTVNVARPTMWGNPWRVLHARFLIHPDGTKEEFLTPEDAHNAAVNIYRTWIEFGLLQRDKRRVPDSQKKALSVKRLSIRQRLPELRGHDLACWCAPNMPCHGDELLDLANGATL
jgi:uncharacterized protein DUF4326